MHIGVSTGEFDEMVRPEIAPCLCHAPRAGGPLGDDLIGRPESASECDYRTPPCVLDQRGHA
jgi:hypothetical protein